MATVRYIVADVPASVEFYTKHLGFEVVDDYGEPFASLRRGDLELWLAGPQSSAARPMPDGAQPQPGGWARIVLEVEDLQARVDELRKAGASFRNEIVSGPGGKQILLEDPSSNVVELFQPAG